jgi:hypothetical protein
MLLEKSKKGPDAARRGYIPPFRSEDCAALRMILDEALIIDDEGP